MVEDKKESHSEHGQFLKYSGITKFGKLSNAGQALSIERDDRKDKNKLSTGSLGKSSSFYRFRTNAVSRSGKVLRQRMIDESSPYKENPRRRINLSRNKTVDRK